MRRRTAGVPTTRTLRRGVDAGVPTTRTLRRGVDAGVEDGGETAVVLRARCGIGQRLVCNGELRGARRSHFLELGPEVDDFVGVIARNLAAKRLLDLVRIGAG